jgi:ankyrin repeat protein
VRVQIGWTPLHLAAQNGHVEVTRSLLSGGASVDAACKVAPPLPSPAPVDSHSPVLLYGNLQDGCFCSAIIRCNCI